MSSPKLVKVRQPSLGARFVMSSLVARLHDASVTPEAWPDALTALTDAAGVTADDATAHAIVVAQGLAQDGSWHGSSILVTDDRGHEIVRARIGR